ncbi:protein mei2-like 2 [Anaeramoeba flamelloides]|uniref:Protein mei2-like 2 n=1 Tax=Anaeramoeba flamelloides TaxID=1746091 RepID=A0ABQ8YB02_9EUKA|nr:protein mei2-like 2 [Anaeramoeba flamelloides]
MHTQIPILKFSSLFNLPTKFQPTSTNQNVKVEKQLLNSTKFSKKPLYEGKELKLSLNKKKRFPQLKKNFEENKLKKIWNTVPNQILSEKTQEKPLSKSIKKENPLNIGIDRGVFKLSSSFEENNMIQKKEARLEETIIDYFPKINKTSKNKKTNNLLNYQKNNSNNNYSKKEEIKKDNKFNEEYKALQNPNNKYYQQQDYIQDNNYDYYEGEEQNFNLKYHHHHHHHHHHEKQPKQQLGQQQEQLNYNQIPKFQLHTNYNQDFYPMDHQNLLIKQQQFRLDESEQKEFLLQRNLDQEKFIKPFHFGSWWKTNSKQQQQQQIQLQTQYQKQQQKQLERKERKEHPLGEYPNRALFIRNINSNIEDELLDKTFGQFGEIKEIYSKSKFRGFVLIKYYDIRHSINAIEQLQGKEINGRKLDIHFSIPKENPKEEDQNQGTVVCFNLDETITNEKINEIFSQVGEINEIRSTPNKFRHRFIEYYDIRNAEKAIKILNNTLINEREIKVELSRAGGIRSKLLSTNRKMYQNIKKNYKTYNSTKRNEPNTHFMNQKYNNQNKINHSHNNYQNNYSQNYNYNRNYNYNHNHKFQKYNNKFQSTFNSKDLSYQQKTNYKPNYYNHNQLNTYQNSYQNGNNWNQNQDQYWN